MMGHRHPKVWSPCFPKEQCKNRVYVEPSSIHVNCLEFQSVDQESIKTQSLRRPKFKKMKSYMFIIRYFLIRPDLLPWSKPKEFGVCEPRFVICNIQRQKLSWKKIDAFPSGFLKLSNLFSFTSELSINISMASSKNASPAQPLQQKDRTLQKSSC